MGDSILEFESLQMIVNQYDAKKAALYKIQIFTYDNFENLICSPR